MKDQKDLSGTSLTEGASVSVSASDAASHDETAQEMLDRLSLIVLGERDCDLSDNDTAALEWALTTRAEMLASLKEMREACCAAMRVVADLDMAERLGWSAEQKQQRFIDELHFAGVKDGFGVRAQNAIAKAEPK